MGRNVPPSKIKLGNRDHLGNIGFHHHTSCGGIDASGKSVLNDFSQF